MFCSLTSCRCCNQTGSWFWDWPLTVGQFRSAPSYAAISMRRAQLLEPPPQKQSQQSQKVDSNHRDNIPTVNTTSLYVYSHKYVWIVTGKTHECRLTANIRLLQTRCTLTNTLMVSPRNTTGPPALRDLVQRLQEVYQTLYQMSVCLNSWRSVCSDTQNCQSF